MDDFTELTRQIAFAPGIGLPGQVWASGEPQWIGDVARDGNFLRAAAAAKVGLCWAFGFPIRFHEKNLGIIEFFSRDVCPPDQDLLKMMASIGSQIGQFIERKQAEAELLKAKNAAETASELKSRFLANMSHELRTPLAAILGYAEIIRDQVSDSRTLENLAIVESSGQDLLQLIDNILDLSKMEAEKLPLEKVECSPVQIVKNVLESLRIQDQEKKLTLALRLETPIPELILSDPARIQQVLTNLIGNAVKFTETGSVTVSLRLVEEQKRALKLEFQIKDTGIGIPKEKFECLFKPFSQVDPTATRKYGGTGLGLALSHRIAQLLEGELTVKSKVGFGSSFTFKIPSNRGTRAH
jgi:signal transduction histidine kinase